MKQAYRINEMEKKRSYNERILNVENGTFTPLVFSVSGGMGPVYSMFFNDCLALLQKNETKIFH